MPVFKGKSDNKFNFIPLITAIGLNHILMIQALSIARQCRSHPGYKN